MPERDALAVLIETAFKSARKEGLSVADAADLVADVVRARLEERILDQSEVNHNMINVQSIYGAKTGLPLVDFSYGFEHFTLDVDSAREHALAILTCAEAASQDAGVYRWLTLSTLGLDARAAQAAIADLRRFRGDAQKEDWRTPEQKASGDA